jgi:protoheme IX farnesyltransferase
MPHFWMMMLKYGAEYRKAGFPTLLDIFSEFQIKIIVMVWITASSAVSMMFVYFRMVSHLSIATGILSINVLLLILLIQQLFIAKTRKNHLIFISANLYVFSVLVLMILDKYISAL